MLYSGFFAGAQRHVQTIATLTIVGSALALTSVTLSAALGFVPWLDLHASAGGTPLENAGIYAQIAVTVLMALLAVYLPASRRVLRLEQSHRDFTVSMDDIVRAYRLSHQADRDDHFQLSQEFDAIRERMRHMRDHPELSMLEPEILELAAQMSHISRDIAEVYSEKKVERARLFLGQRQQEVDRLLEHIAMAKKTTEDLRHWMLQLDAEQATAEKQLAALEADLMDLLPELGFEIGSDDEEAHIVVPMVQSPRTPTTPDL